MKENNPKKKHTVFLQEDDETKLRKLTTAVKRDLALESVGKAYQRLEDHYDGMERTLVTDEECRLEFKKKHPEAVPMPETPLPEGIVQQEQMEAIEAKEIKSIILHLKKGKAPGADGLTASHLKYLVREHPFFLTILETFFN